MILSFLTKYFDYVMIALIIGNLYLRKYPYGQRKRFALILWAIDVLGVYALLLLISQFSLPAYTEWIAVLLGLVVAGVLKRHFWPFSFRCRKCGKKLSLKEFFSIDENLCEECWLEEHPEEKEKKEEEEKKRILKGDTKNMDLEKVFKEADKIDEIPWGSWEPTERCVLTYVLDKETDQVLMIYKKTGLGNGYINAPGGHIELEETSVEAAIRETKEETGLDVEDLEEMGTLHFQFKDGLRMLGYVFFAHSYSGDLIDECEETKPFWIKRSELDYSKMWADDPYWLPQMMEGKKFDAYFLFEDRTLLDHKVEILEEDE
ncbi:MAG: NUDIX domain-containing protein [Spirochaetales bacterium]|nr:NUDIX domain-containing protein [Candidatus Physcosoma equi]